MKKAEILPLTGLRGVAALCVLIGHYFFWVSPITTGQLYSRFSQYFVEGFNLSHHGMALFFTLSGFVIAYNYVNLDWENNPLKSLWIFFVHRFARLYPLLISFIIILLWTFPDFTEASITGNQHIQLDIITALMGVMSWFPYLATNGEQVINGNFFIIWSISTEFFLYITFAIMMLVVSRCGKTFGLKCLLAYLAITVLLLLAWNAAYSYFQWMPQDKYNKWLFEASPYCRMIEFCAGMVGYWLLFIMPAPEPDSKKHAAYKQILLFASEIGITILTGIWAINLIWKPISGHFTTHIMMVIGAFFLITGSTQVNKINKFLSSSYMLFIGTISYSFYLFHYLPPHFITQFITVRTSHIYILMFFAINFILCTFFTLAIATGLYQLIEVPARRYLRQKLLR